MIEPLDEMPDGVLGFRAVDEVEAEDYQRVLRPAIEAAIEAHGKVRFVYLLGPAFDEYEGGAMLEDAKLGVEHPFSFERVAIVTDAAWAKPAMRAFSVLWPGVFRAFPVAELEDAKAWAAA
jgi:SpoIIAA-like